LTTLAMLEPPLCGLQHDAARPAGPSATPTLTPMSETSRIYCSKFQAKITASRSHAMQVQYVAVTVVDNVDVYMNVE